MNEHNKSVEELLKIFKEATGVTGLTDHEEKIMDAVLRDLIVGANLEIEEIEYLTEEAEMFEATAQMETNALFARLGIK